jgi:type II secretory pathway pseudopilin PulG
MKIACIQARRLRRTAGISMPELMISLSIFGMMVAGLLAINLFGMRQDGVVNSKLGANDQSRLAFALLLSEIRSCKNLQIGSGSQTTFKPVTNGVAQQGNALQIYPLANNTNLYVRYYFDSSTTNPSTNELHRISSTNHEFQIVVRNLTNTMFFQAADYTGTNVLTQSPTNYNHNFVVNVLFQFYQFEYPLTKVGPGYYYDYYKVQFKATRRSP